MFCSIVYCLCLIKAGNTVKVNKTIKDIFAEGIANTLEMPRGLYLIIVEVY
jgi:hypothetical protein